MGWVRGAGCVTWENEFLPVDDVDTDRAETRVDVAYV